MSGSILKESTFTPQSFNKNFNLSNHRRFGKLINILENLIESGIIIAANSSWKNEVYSLIEEYDEYDKDELISLLKELDSRQRLAYYPNQKNFQNEDQWLEETRKLQNIRDFDFIIGTQDNDIVSTVDNIDRKKYLNTGAKITLQNKENMKSLLAPILSYAEIATVIDPYFHLESSNNRYEDSLEVICKTLGNKHGISTGAIIEIQTSIKPLINRDNEFDWRKVLNWSKILKQYELKYKHQININIWEDLKKEKEWHDRWIVTNHCAVFIGKGSDISNWTDSTWDLVDWDEIPKISNNFNKNREIYNFIGSITSSSCKKTNNPKSVKVVVTEEERKEKLARPVKNFRKR